MQKSRSHVSCKEINMYKPETKKAYLIEKAGLCLYILAMTVLLGLQAVASVKTYFAREVCLFFYILWKA